MSHTCDETTKQLYTYLDAELDERTAASIRGHLEDCPGCFEGFQFERRLKDVIRGCLSEDMPEALVNKVKDLIRQEQAST